MLANVDVRTVRNAVSSGALPADDGRIGCYDARAWLLGRKGFKPTIRAHEGAMARPEVGSAEQFGALLRQCRIRRLHELVTSAEAVLDPLAGELPLDAYPAGLTQEMLREVEAGVFRLPLNLVAPLADFYGLPREDFLRCAMRVFFPSSSPSWPAKGQQSPGGPAMTSRTTTPRRDEDRDFEVGGRIKPRLTLHAHLLPPIALGGIKR